MTANKRLAELIERARGATDSNALQALARELGRQGFACGLPSFIFRLQIHQQTGWSVSNTLHIGYALLMDEYQPRNYPITNCTHEISLGALQVNPELGRSEILTFTNPVTPQRGFK